MARWGMAAARRGAARQGKGSTQRMSVKTLALAKVRPGPARRGLVRYGMAWLGQARVQVDEQEDNSMTDTELHPSYLEVAKTIVEGDHSPGVIFTHEWLKEGLHIRVPLPDEMLTTREHRKLDLAYMEAMNQLRALLLEEHHIDLKSVPTEGYQVLSPDDQIRHGHEKFEDGLRKVSRKAAARFMHVDVGRLSAAACAAQVNGLARVGALSVIMRKRSFAGSEQPVPVALPEKT